MSVSYLCTTVPNFKVIREVVVKLLWFVPTNRAVPSSTWWLYWLRDQVGEYKNSLTNEHWGILPHVGHSFNTFHKLFISARPKVLVENYHVSIPSKFGANGSHLTNLQIYLLYLAHPPPFLLYLGQIVTILGEFRWVIELSCSNNNLSRCASMKSCGSTVIEATCSHVEPPLVLLPLAFHEHAT